MVSGAADRIPGQGDFIDDIVASTTRSLISQLKEEYKKELRKSVEAAREAQCGMRTRPYMLAEAPWSSPTPPHAPPLAGGIPPSLEYLNASSGTTAGLAHQVAISGWGYPEVQDTDSGKVMDVAQLPGLNVLDSASTEISEENIVHLDANMTQSCEGELPGAVPSPDAVAVQSKQHDGQAGDSLPIGSSKAMWKLSEEDEIVIKSLRAESKVHDDGFESAGPRSVSMSMDSTIFKEASWSRQVAIKIIKMPAFDFAMGFIIVANACTIGLESSITVSGEDIPTYLHVLEYLFLIVYSVELCLRFYARGALEALASNWVKFDAALVLSGIANVILVATSLGGDAASKTADKINMLKMVRLIRLARTVRVLVQFRTLWLLVQGLMYAILPMLWTCLIMIVVVYVFAVVGMELIVDPTADDAYRTAAENFDNIGDGMLTLLQFITLDSMAGIYRPLIAGKSWVGIYFLAFFLVGPVALMNIVTAIMVESSLRTANQDMEAKKAWEAMRRKEMMPKLRSIFISLDTDGSGEVDMEELQSAPEDVKDQMRRIVDLDELEEVFKVMDFDGSGSVSIDEFVDGIMRSQAEKPSELMILVKQGKAILDQLKTLEQMAS